MISIAWITAGVTSVIFAVIAALVLYAERQSTAIQNHLNLVTSSLQDVLSDLADAEVEERGHLLSGRPRSLEKLANSRRALSLDLMQLGMLVKENPTDRREVERIRYLVQRELEDLQTSLGTRAQATAAATLPNRAMALTAALRESIQRIDNEHETAMAEVTRERRVRLTSALAAAWGALLLAGSCLMISQIIISRSASRREESEAALHTIQNRFETFCEQAPLGIYSTDAEGFCVYTNSRWSQITGLSAAESLGHGWKKALHPDDRKTVFQGWKANLQQGASWEYRLQAPQGKISWIRALGGPIHSSTGEITGYVGTVEDITDRKQAVRALEEREALNRAVLNSLPANIAVLDSKGVIQAINEEWQGFAKANGNPPAASVGVGANYLEVCRRAAVDGLGNAEKALIGIRGVLAGTLQSFALGYPCHSATTHRWFHMLVTPLPGVASGGAVITHIDITERKRARAIVREALQQLQLITDNMPAVVMRCSRDLRFVWVSPGYAAWLGLRGPEEVAGRPILEIVGQNSYETIQPYVERVLSGQRVEFEAQVRYQAIGMRWINAVYVPTKAADSTVDGWIAVISDVTERHEAEEHLRESEERFRVTFYQAAVGIAQTGIDGRWMLLNDRLCDFLGYSREELLGKTFIDITHPEDREISLAAVRQLIGGDISSWSSEKRYIRGDGVTVWGKVFVSLVRGQNSQPLYFVTALEDVTERVRAQEKVRESEERFRALVTASSDVIYRMSPDWAEMRCLRGKDFIVDTEGPSGAWLQRYIYPEDQQRVMAAVNRAVANNEAFELEHRVFRKDGTLGWTSSRAIPIRNALGEIVEWFGTAKDVTDRRQAEEKLRESEARFRNMADAAPVMIWVSGPDKGCTFFNKVWRDFTGRTTDQESGSGWTEGVHPADRERCLAIYSSSFDLRHNFQMEYRLRRTDGEYRWVLDKGVPRFAVGGAFEGYIGSCIDITERMQEEELREELRQERERLAEARGLERFRLSFEEAPVGMALIRGDGAWLRVNRVLSEMTGYTESELISRGREITHPEDRLEESLLLSRLRSRELNSGRLEERYLHKHGNIIYILLSMATVERDGYGRPIHFVAHVQDLTERKRVEAELEASRAQMVTSSRLSALGMMAGAIAHEINNPLGIIHASAENMARMVESGSLQTPSLLKNCNRISLTADRIAKIVRSLRHIAREGSADEFREASVREIVDETLELCAERFRVHNIRLTVPSVIPTAVIACREAQICQVLLNLLQNSFDELVERGGDRWVELDVTLSPPLVVFTVRDSGPGIAPENRAHVMEPFFTTKPVGKGTGLGLSISRSIALEHGGTLELDPQSAHTCFLLKLPLSGGTRGD